MTAIRRTAFTLALTLAAILSSAGSTAPAQASFSDSASRTTAITAAVVAPPVNVTGSLVCAPTSTMGVTWGQSPTARVSGYTVTVYFSDGYVQTVDLGPNATSWSTTIAKYYVTAYYVEYTVTTKTNYGWSTSSARTGAFQC